MLHENSNVSDSGTGRTVKAKRASRAARKTRRGGSAAPKMSLYDEVTAQIIAQLEEGVFPWVKPWDSGNAVTGLPRNAITGRHYSGINILILWGAVIDGGYLSPALKARGRLTASHLHRRTGRMVCFGWVVN